MVTRKPILCLDFDATISDYASGWVSADRIPDGPVPGAMHAIAAYSDTFRVAIYSSRTGQPGGLHAMQQWLRQHLLRELGAEEGDRVWHLVEWPHSKPPAFVTLDDRAITFTGTWPSVDQLATFQPWNKRDAEAEVTFQRELCVAVAESVNVAYPDGGELTGPDANALLGELATRGYRIVRA